MNKKNELKPCPFCGDEPNINQLNPVTSEGCFWGVFCDWGTEHYLTIKAGTREEAIKLWNCRHTKITSTQLEFLSEGYADKFREYYKRLLHPDIIESSIKWQIDLIKKYVKQKEK